MPPPFTSDLDYAQIIKKIFDEPTGSIRTNATFSPTGAIEVAISNLEDSIAIGTATDLFTSTTVGPKVGLDVSVISGALTGSFTISGLFEDIKTSSLVVTDVPTAVPVTALTDRNTLSVRVWDDSTVYFGGASVTSASGYPKKKFEEISMDITDNPAVSLYAVCASGESSIIKIMEIA